MENLALSNTFEPEREIADKQAETGYENLALQAQDGTFTLTVMVSGVTCAMCIQKIESSLNDQPDVKAVRLNFGAGRLFIEWSGDAARANDFVQKVEALGYGVQPYDEKRYAETNKSEERFLLLCLGVAGFAAGNVMLLSVGVWSTTAETMGMATRDLMHWISALIALPAILFSGRPFFRSALKVLVNGHTNMDVPISLALLLAGGASLFETINHGEHVYFDSAVMLMFFLLIGRYLDFKARDSARSSAHDLLKSFQGFANVLEGEKTKRILIRDLKEGMVVKVAAGESFPVDGTIIQGKSSIDTSLVTGETLPKDIGEDANVFAGTLNLTSPVIMKVAKAAENSLLSDIVRLMDKAGQGQAAYVRIADKAAKLYTPVVHSMAALTFIGWITIGGLDWPSALMIAVTVLIITCPCALGLAVPVVQVLATGTLMKKGVFVKSGDALERLAAADVVIFDKTGTLTLGKAVLEGEYNKNDMQLAASLGALSAHPLSKAIVDANHEPLLEVENVQEHPGQGMSVMLRGSEVKLGSRAFCGDENADPASAPELWLSLKGQAPVRFTFKDELREDASSVIDGLQAQNMKSILVSGDQEPVVEMIAKEAGIKEWHAQQTPVQKYDILEGLQTQGYNVLMVGDGLNDAPVLAGANVSIAPGTAVDMAQNAADIVFMGDKLSPVMETHKTAKFTQTLVKQNFALAIAYNVVAIPLAVLGFVTPFIAALAMSGSSIVVIANSFRLKLKS